jgi:hypothetical protein
MLTPADSTAEVTMVGTRSAGERTTGEIARCAEGGHVPGSEVDTPEIGRTSYGGEEYWAALRDGETIRSLCARCGAPLSVSLTVRTWRK